MSNKFPHEKIQKTTITNTSKRTTDVVTYMLTRYEWIV